MDCPNGHGPMTCGQRSWFCEQCGHRTPLPAGAGNPPPAQPPPTRPTTLPGLDRLPSLLALPLHEYAAEAHPVMRLHRLCDAIELLTRFLTVVALGELRAVGPADGPLPEGLLRELRPQVERPTFGQWRNMLRATAGALGRGVPLAVPELPAFVVADLLPALPGGDASPRQCLVRLRNDLAHAGAMTRAAAGDFLDVWGPWLADVVGRLAFLADADVCHVAEANGHGAAGVVARRLVGPAAAAGAVVDLPADVRRALQGAGGHVVLVRRPDDRGPPRWLDLWPLCDYGRAGATTLDGRREAAADGPLVYVRAERARLLYAALGADVPHGERLGDAVATFRALFRLDARRADKVAGPVAGPADFDEDIRADAAALVGRTAEVRRVKDAVRAAAESAGGGVVWLSGPGGIGKSFLLAKVADDLRGAPRRRLLCVAWRFKAGGGERFSRHAFFRHAVGRLADWLGRPGAVPAADPDELGGQLADLLDAAAAGAADTAADAPPSDRPSSPRRVVFVVDGLDEIARADPDFMRVPFRLRRPNVVWLCAGRPEPDVVRVFTADACAHVYPGGVPEMNPHDIRGLLVDRTGSLKYDLLRLDEERSPSAPGTADGAARAAGAAGAAAGTVANAAVAAVVDRAAGLPLYVHFVVQDVLSGRLRFADLAGRLPPGLSAYYDDLLRRLGIGELQALLTPLVVTLAWAREPLGEDVLLWVLARRGVLAAGDDYDRGLLRRALAAVGSMVRPAPAPGGGDGYEPYHLSFRDHVRRDVAGDVGRENDKARDALCALATGWRDVPAGHPARGYAFRQGPPTLVDAGRFADVARLARDGFVAASADALGGYDALIRARSVVAALAAAARADPTRSTGALDALAAYAGGYCAVAERVRDDPPDLEGLFDRGDFGAALARIDAEADDRRKAVLSLAGSAFARAAGRPELAAPLRARAEHLRADLDELGFARSCLVVALLDGPADGADGASVAAPPPEPVPDPRVRPRRWLAPWEVAVLLAASPYRAWWATVGMYVGLTGAFVFLVLLAIVASVLPASVRHHGDVVLITVLAAGGLFAAAHLAGLLAGGFPAGWAAAFGRRAFGGLLEGLVRSPDGPAAAGRLARLMRLRAALAGRGVAVDDGRLAAVAARQFRRAPTAEGAADVLAGSADAGRSVAAALAAELAACPAGRRAEIVAAAIRAAPAARDPFAVAVLVAPAAARLEADGEAAGTPAAVGWADLLSFGELAAAVAAFRRVGPPGGMFHSPTSSDRIGPFLAEQRNLAAVALRRAPDVAVAWALLALPPGPGRQYLHRVPAAQLRVVVDRTWAAAGSAWRSAFFPGEPLLTGPVMYAGACALYPLARLMTGTGRLAGRALPRPVRAGLTTAFYVLFAPFIAAFADLGRPARVGVDRRSMEAASDARRSVLVLFSNRDYDLCLEHFCWAGFRESVLADAILSDGVEAGRAMKLPPRAWRTVLGRLMALDWATPEGVIPAVMESRPLLRAALAATRPGTAAGPARPRPTADERAAQLRRACSPEPRWARGLVITALAVVGVWVTMHLAAGMAGGAGRPPLWVYSASLGLAAYWGLAHVWAPRRTMIRILLFAAATWAFCRWAAGPPHPAWAWLLPRAGVGRHSRAAFVWFTGLVWAGPLVLLLAANRAVLGWRGSGLLFPTPAELRRVRAGAVAWLVGCSAGTALATALALRWWCGSGG